MWKQLIPLIIVVFFGYLCWLYISYQLLGH
jgi:hypothetical protein